jgi:hypothetical protein
LAFPRSFALSMGLLRGKKKSVAIEENTIGSYQSTFLKSLKLYKTQDKERRHIFF